MLRRTLVIFFLLISVFTGQELSAQSKTSTKSSTWSDATAWSPSGVPTATDNVQIADGHNITITSNAACNNLTIASAATATLSFANNTARTFTINGDVTNRGLFNVLTSSNATHSVVIRGNLFNSGTFDLNADGNSRADYICNNTTADQVISGTGALTDFFRITVTKGSLAYQLDITADNFNAGSNFLLLNSGIIKFSMPSTSTFVPATSTLFIGSNAGLWMNTSTAVLNFSSAVSSSGLFRMTNGTVNVGNGNNEDFIATGGTLEIQGGALEVAGKYQATTGATVFRISGGSLRVPAVSTSNTGVAPFFLTAANSTFDMSGGTIIVRREGGTGTQDLGFQNTGGTLGSVTGGTLQFGDATTPASQTVNINCAVPIPNLVLNSSNITVKLNSNPLSVLNDVRIAAGVLNSTSLSINAQGNWSNSGTFSPGTGTVTFAANATQTITRPSTESFNHVRFTGTGTKVFSTPITVTGNFSIASGAVVDVSASNYSLSVAGNFVNSGSFNGRSGLVRLNGSTAQSLSGSSTTDFNDLTITNAAGVTMNAGVNINGSLLLTNGVLNTNSQALTIVSNATNTGRIGPITGTGNLNGNVTIQRFLPGGSTGWNLLGVPVSSGLTFADWDDDLYITCPTCPDGFSNFYSVYSYDETQPGVYDAPASYQPVTSLSTPLVAGKGYWVYAGSSQFTTTGITLDVTGPINKFAYAIPLTRTNYGSAADDGWNLIHNPYPSAISWAALKGAVSNIDNAIYVYNPDLNGGTGGYASYVNGISSPAVAAGGVDDNIAMGQGFYVHSTGATSLSALETNKVTNNPVMLRPVAPPPMIRFTLSDNNFKDETVLYFEQGATNGFDPVHDAFKMRGQDPMAPTVQLFEQGQQLQINAVAPLSGTLIQLMQVLTGYTGTYTLSASDFGNLPKGTCLSLFDKVTGLSTDLLQNNYVFTLQDTTQAPRFEIHIAYNPAVLNANVFHPTCAQPDNGSIVVSSSGQGPFVFNWKLNGNVVKTYSGNNNTDTLFNLSGGQVELETSQVLSCMGAQADFAVMPVILPVAQFSSPDTVLAGNNFALTNKSQDAVSAEWNFNDGNFSYDINPAYVYQQPGRYDLTLVATSSTGCLDKVSRPLQVMDPLGISKVLHEQEWILRALGKGQFELDTRGENITKVLLTDLQGSETGLTNLQSSLVRIDLSACPRGLYLLRCNTVNGSRTIRLLNQ